MAERKEWLFIMMGVDTDGYPAEQGSVKASTAKEAIEKSLDPETATMYLPTHMQNQDEYGKESNAVVRRIALESSLHYFDLDGAKKKRYTKEYTMLMVDLETGAVAAH